jgi:two-component system, NarL family, response regulator LiaR
MAPASIPVFLVGHRHATLDAAFGNAPELHPAGAAPSPRDAIPMLKEVRPGVTILDLDLRESTVAALPSLQAPAPDSRILAITDSADPVRHTAALYAGARGLVRKHQIPELLPRAIPKILAGELWFERQLVASALLAMLAVKRRFDDQGDRRTWLAPRRRDMLGFVGEGLPDDEIAARLALPPGVVRIQIAALTKKLGLASRLELVAYAHHSGALPRSTVGATG